MDRSAEVGLVEGLFVSGPGTGQDSVAEAAWCRIGGVVLAWLRQYFGSWREVWDMISKIYADV